MTKLLVHSEHDATITVTDDATITDQYSRPGVRVDQGPVYNNRPPAVATTAHNTAELIALVPYLARTRGIEAIDDAPIGSVFARILLPGAVSVHQPYDAPSEWRIQPGFEPQF